MAYEIKIARFELFPADAPDCYCVGFAGTAANGRSHYQDTQVTLQEAQGKTDEEITALAWEKVKDGFAPVMESLAVKSALLGKVWDPELKIVKTAAKESL